MANEVVRSEGGGDHLVGYLTLVLLHGVERAVAEDVGAAVRKDEGRRRDYQEERRDYIPRFDRQLAPERDLGHKALVVGLVYGLREEDQQPRHEQEHREHAHDDGLYEHDAHVVAQAEVHERQGRGEAGDRREAGGAYLGYGLERAATAASLASGAPRSSV